MMRQGVLVLFFGAFAAAPLPAQVRDFYDSPEEARGCIGGRRCGGSNARLRVALDDRRVSEIRFRAHDDIGDSRNGRLRVSIDGIPLESSIDISSQPGEYTVHARETRGRELVFEPVSDDEVEITEVRIRYDGAGGGGGGSDDGGGCIGGARCGGFGAKLRIRLEGRPVSEIRFRAHDDIGGSRGGRLRVSIDGTPVEGTIDVSSQEERYTLQGRGMRGRELVFEPASDDEVEIGDVRVLYSGDGGGGETSQGGCIGGSRCGGSRSSIRIPLRDRPVREVTFYAHDDVGGSRDGRLRVRIDGAYIERGLDIRRSNERYTLNVNGVLGRELVFEPASNDEVEVRDIRVRYGRGERQPF